MKQKMKKKDNSDELLTKIANHIKEMKSNPETEISKELLEIEKEIQKMKAKNPTPETETPKLTAIDFDTEDYPENSEFGKYTVAVHLTEETARRLKARAFLNDEDVSTHVSKLIETDVEEAFCMNPNEFMNTVYETAEEKLCGTFDEYVKSQKSESSKPLIEFISKTEIENLTVNINIGSGDSGLLSSILSRFSSFAKSSVKSSDPTA
jgi:hypothetical protein